MKRLLACCVWLAVAGNVDAATYYASPSGGGAASCVDNSTNVCTLARSIIVAATGDTISAACGTYDLGSSALAVNKNVIIDPLTPADASNPSCAIITSSNATSTIDLTASNDANTLRFGAFEVRNTGSAGQVIRIVSAAYDATVQIYGTWVPTGGTNRHISDAWVRGTVQLVRPILSGTIGAQAGFYSIVTPTSAKTVTIDGMTGTMTASASNTPIIYLERAAGNSVAYTATVANTNIAVTVPSSLGTSALGIGIRFHRMDNALAYSNQVFVSTLGSTGVDALGIVASSTDATATANNAVFHHNTVTCYGPSTRCISIGTDGVTAFNASNALIYRNTVTNPYYDGTSTPHGISIGRVTGGIAWGNTVNGFAVGLIAAINQGAVFSGNLVRGAYYAPLFSKGSGGTTAPTFSNNTVIMDDTLYGPKFNNYGCQGVASQAGTNNTDTLFYNNICSVKNGTGWKYTVVDASQAAHFDGNDYYSEVALTTPWNYQGTSYASLDLWNAAATVGTELSSNPVFINPATSDYRLSGISPLRRAGVIGAACYEFRGRQCWFKPDIGAYQSSSGDPATPSTSRY